MQQIEINTDHKTEEINKINNILGDRWSETEKTIGYAIYNAIARGFKVYVFKEFVFPRIVGVRAVVKETEKAVLLACYPFDKIDGEYYVFDGLGAKEKWFAKSTIEYIFFPKPGIESNFWKEVKL